MQAETGAYLTGVRVSFLVTVDKAGKSRGVMSPPPVGSMGRRRAVSHLSRSMKPSQETSLLFFTHDPRVSDRYGLFRLLSVAIYRFVSTGISICSVP